MPPREDLYALIRALQSEQSHMAAMLREQSARLNEQSAVMREQAAVISELEAEMEESSVERDHLHAKVSRHAASMEGQVQMLTLRDQERRQLDARLRHQASRAA